MGALHIAGFEIHVERGGSDASSEGLGGGGFSVTGTSLGGELATVERLSATTKLIKLSEAISLESLCRRGNGNVWHCNNSVYSGAGLGMTDTPTFQAGTKKFGTHAISISGSAGNVQIATVGSLYTVAAWAKDGAGDWEHHILRSDGAKWVDGVRNDGATLDIEVNASVLELVDHASNTRYFDDVVWLPFEIWDDWGADWPLAADFSDLPGLEITGDLLGGYRIDGARARARIMHAGYVGQFGGQGARVSLDITGPERVVDA